MDSGEKKEDYEEWHKSHGILMPKNGDTSNPDKWREINLLDACPKILRRILSSRLHMLLENMKPIYLAPLQEVFFSLGGPSLI